MSLSKWPYIQRKLPVIEGLAREGWLEKDICKKMDIGHTAWSQLKKAHPELVEALIKGKEDIDVQVENALLKRALGYEYEETKTIVENPDGTAGPRQVRIERVKKHVPPDTVAGIFWMKNRKPALWRDKRELEHSGQVTNPYAALSEDELKRLAQDDDD